jgi:hypothetical protein
MYEQIYALKRETFPQLSNEWTERGILDATGEQVSVKDAISDGEMESAHELQFRVGEDDTDTIPAVRYAQTHHNTAIVYAIQLPLMDGHSKISLEKAKQSYPDKEGKYPLIEEKFRSRDEKLRRFNQFFNKVTTDANGARVERAPGDLAMASPSAVLSLAGAAVMFSEKGIHTLKIPILMPWRQHVDTREYPEGEKMDEAILTQKMLVARRVAYEVDGIEISSYGEEDGYIHLKIGKNLSSRRPILSEMLSLVKSKQEEHDEEKELVTV